MSFPANLPDVLSLKVTFGRQIKRLLILSLWVITSLTIPATSSWAVEFKNSEHFDFSETTPGQQLGCLAMNIYHEGRGESAKGRAAIASVTMNRVKSKHYPHSICEVVWQRKQFSWTKVAPRHHVVRDGKAWQQALIMAKLFIDGARDSEVGKATHYHALHVTPSWIDTTKLVAYVGRHAFYTL